MEFIYSLFGVIIGIIFSDMNFATPFIILECVLALLLLITSIISKRFNTSLLVLITVLALGFISGNIALNQDNSTLNKFNNKEVSIIGRVIDLPSKNNSNYSYIVKLHNIKDENVTHKVNENIRLTTKSQLNYDDVIIFNSKLKEIPSNSNEFGFNSKIYYKSQGIYYKAYAEECELANYKLSNLDLYSFITTIRSKMYQTINKYYTEDDAALLCAISLGNKNGFSDDFEQLLDRTGVKRCLYPAFIQIMLFMFLLSLVQTKVPQKVRFLILSVFLIIFGVGNSMNPVFIKSAFIVAVFYATRQFTGFVIKQDIIFIVITGMLIANPLLLYNGGFVCSCVANILIVFFLPALREKLKFIKSNYIKNTVGIGIICSVGLFPLSAYYFNGVATYQIIATLLLIPMTVVVFILSPILTILLDIFGSAPIISNIIDFILYMYKGVPYLIVKLPYEYISVAVPSVLLILAFYLVVYSLYKYIDRRKFYIPLLVGIVIICFAFTKEFQRINTAEITFINVGQGDAALVSAPYRYNIIIDGGGGYDFAKTEEEKAAAEDEYNIGEEVFVPYLQTHGVSHIDAAFVSHYHKDHVEGIVSAIEMLDVDIVYMPDLLRDNEWRKKIEQAANKYGTKIKYIKEDSQISYGGFYIKIFYPTNTALLTEDENNTSLLYKINYGKTSALFTGDMTALYEASMVYGNKNIDCDILKVAHHGSSYSTCKEFVSATSPEYAVISLGENNPYGFPRKEVLDNLSNINVYRTDINGDIRFTINNDGIKSIYTLR